MCNDFSGHSGNAIKAFNRGHHVCRCMLKWIIMQGGLTPGGQPLERLINKLCQGYLRELYDIFSLTTTFNPATGAPCPLSHQKISTCIVEAWDQVSEELCDKACTGCGYKTNN